MGFDYDPMRRRADHLEAELWQGAVPEAKVVRMFRHIALLAFSCLMIATARGDALTPWQETVAAQIAALQEGEAEVALALAGARFREGYADPQRFLADIERAGYGPIIAARTHRFGTFRETEGGLVLQVVTLTGPDQSLYEAIYELIEEPDQGWRVRGVVLRKLPGLGV